MYSFVYAVCKSCWTASLTFYQCQYGEWSGYTQCSSTCGKSAVRNRNRTVLSKAITNKTSCFATIDSQNCNLQECVSLLRKVFLFVCFVVFNFMWKVHTVTFDVESNDGGGTSSSKGSANIGLLVDNWTMHIRFYHFTVFEVNSC